MNTGGDGNDSGRLKRITSIYVVVGAVIVVIVIAATAMWTSIRARFATNEAVEQVSEFYLRELAKRRSQSVKGIIYSRIEDMRLAVKTLEYEDLASQEALRSFIGDIETLLDLDLLAFVDEDDVVYTEYSTYTGKSRHKFLADMPDEGSSISTVVQYTGRKQICIAIPIQGVIFQGKKLKACFVEIAIEDFADTLYFGTGDEESVFGLYYRDGSNLTNNDFGPIGADENLLDVVGSMLPPGKDELLRENFSQGKTEGLEFMQGQGDDILYYTPIGGTDWMMCVLLHKSVISEQIRGINEETIRRSRIQIAVTGLVILLFFGGLFLLTHRRAKNMLAREKKNSRTFRERAKQSERELGQVRELATRDAMTGVGNKLAYTEQEAALNEALEKGQIEKLAILSCDLNGLKKVNDEQGHIAGDNYIREAGKMICDFYKHSSVFRTGGDEFAVIMRSEDYDNRYRLLEEFNRQAEENIKTGKAVISVGMAELEDGDRQLSDIFKRADESMYVRKMQMKKLGASVRE
ncbi:MAG: GGDEF domain-containing protein [Lachnospiraceae bacterium]|nr:GGDEF domain-containing protein [Lachnospiraceae bacterium]